MSQVARRLLAERGDRDLFEVTNKSAKVASMLIRNTREAVIRAYRQGADPIGEIAPRLKQIIPTATDALIVAHLRSHFRVTQAALKARERTRTTRSRQFSVFDETIAFLRERTRFTPKQIDFLREEYGGRVLAATEEATAEIEQTVQRALLKVQKEGVTLDEAVKSLERTLRRNGLDTDGNRVETMIRTQAAIAQSVGQQRANEDPEIASDLWGYEYFAVGDDRTRPNHQALDGVKLPKDDPRWARIMPPNGFNCRCRVVEVFEKVRIKAPGKKAVPDEGWDFNPVDIFGRGPIPPPAGTRVPSRPKRPAPAQAAAAI